MLEFAAGERAVYRRHRHLLASSPVVAAAARRANPALDVVEAPLSLLPETYPAVPLDGPPVAGLIGTGTWAPTARAIEHAVLRVWPQVLAQVPDARLQVAGRGVAALAALQEPRPGVEVLGEVASARDFLRGLSLLLYPLTRGSGMKVKVLESMASGLPVVTTPCGAEGLRPGDGVVVSDDPRRADPRDGRAAARPAGPAAARRRRPRPVPRPARPGGRRRTGGRAVPPPAPGLTVSLPAASGADATTGRTVMRGSAWNGAALLLPQVYTLVFSVIAARVLGPADLGRQSFIAFLELSAVALFTAGLPKSVMRFVGVEIGAGRLGHVRYLSQWSWRCSAVLGLLGGVAVASHGGVPRRAAAGLAARRGDRHGERDADLAVVGAAGDAALPGAEHRRAGHRA